MCHAIGGSLWGLAGPLQNLVASCRSPLFGYGFMLRGVRCFSNCPQAALASPSMQHEKAALWQMLLMDPSAWQDFRKVKEATGNDHLPDFKEKASGKPLWLPRYLPESVSKQLAAVSGCVVVTPEQYAAEKAQFAKAVHAVHWQSLVTKPDEWLDLQPLKAANRHLARCPDFRHVATKQGLWIDRGCIPDGVLEKLQLINVPVAKDLGWRERSEAALNEILDTPSDWLDCRQYKKEVQNASYPDFRHIITKRGIWLEGLPAWAQEQLAAANIPVFQWVHWQSLLTKPDEWEDLRPLKAANAHLARCPDFRHVATKQGLWLDDYCIPDGVLDKVQLIKVPVAKDMRWNEKSEAVLNEILNSPSDWLDCRQYKEEVRSPTYPDFRNPNTKEGIWLPGLPDRAEEKLAAAKIPVFQSETISLWKSLLQEPQHWYDFRQRKAKESSAALPDFVHARTKAGLWLERTSTPAWVKEQLPNLVVPTPEDSSELWNSLFQRPHEWLDLRQRKANERCTKLPDFSHSFTKAGLWLDSKSTPGWVKEQLPELAVPLIKDRKAQVQAAWRSLLDHPDAWLDFRAHKAATGKDSLPDFHPAAGTLGGLWLDCKHMPSNVLEKLPSLNIPVYESSPTKKVAAELWHSLFQHPHEWCDLRQHKANKGWTRLPDFSHLHIKACLWLDRTTTPAWVKEKLPQLQVPLRKAQAVCMQSRTSRGTGPWESLFHSPSSWEDCRPHKIATGNQKLPDFKPVGITGSGLWLDSAPSWVAQRLAELSIPVYQPRSIDPKLEERERQWQLLFEKPAIWEDLRQSKRLTGSTRTPDFRSKRLNLSLWLDSTTTPLWVKERIDTLVTSDAQVCCSTADAAWQSLLSSPAEWLDCRQYKRKTGNQKYPDFKHKQENTGLWLGDRTTPSWVMLRIARLQIPLLDTVPSKTAM